jgi:hypothetical protein
LILTPLLAGCGGPEVLHAGDVTVLVRESRGDSMGAEFRGPLAVVGGCAGAGGAVVVWPHGTEVVATDPLTLDIPGSGRVALGEAFEMGGGFAYEAASSDRDAPAEIGDGVAIPEDCRGLDLWVAANTS